MALLHLQHFKPDYVSARAHFLQCLPPQARPVLHPLSWRGPRGEALVCTHVWHGPATARRVLVLISGTHGVEGLLGSAVQADLACRLHQGQQPLPADTAILFIHLLNPWGCAWLRRCDAEGIDLNRNFIDFSAPLPTNPGYDLLRPALLDPDLPAHRSLLEHYRREHGQRAWEFAISGGQYTDPDGPFYGGQAPAHGHRLVRQWMQQYRLASRHLAVIDLHTGLGTYGEGEVICDHAPQDPGATRARQWYGAEVTLPALGTSSSVPKLGLLDYAWHGIMDEHSCFVTLEFGTFSTDALFEVLLADHARPFQPQQRLSPAGCVQRRRMRHHFYPDHPLWRRRVLERARQVLAQALNGLEQTP